MDYKHCPKCNSKMTIRPNGRSTSTGLECLACGHVISIYDMPVPYRVSLRAASNITFELADDWWQHIPAQPLPPNVRGEAIELTITYNPDLGRKERRRFRVLVSATIRMLRKMAK